MISSTSTIFNLQTYDKARNALALALSPVVRALVDPDGAMRDIRNLDSVRTHPNLSKIFISYEANEELSSFYFTLQIPYIFCNISNFLLPKYLLDAHTLLCAESSFLFYFLFYFLITDKLFRLVLIQRRNTR